MCNVIYIYIYTCVWVDSHLLHQLGRHHNLFFYSDIEAMSAVTDMSTCEMHMKWLKTHALPIFVLNCLVCP